MLFHIGTTPVYNHFDRDTKILEILGAGLDCIFNGPAAVIVFFVISGFCIHYPQSKGGKINVLEFLTRRYIRILIPLLVCMAGTYLMGLPTDTVGDLVGWSIECELVYYTAYPIIYKFSKKIGWSWMIAIMLPVSLVYVSMTVPNAMMYPSFGLIGNSLLGFPCWLLGCKLAHIQKPKRKTRSIWFSRITIMLCSMLTFSLMLHAKIGFPWTLNFFAIGVFFWLGHEITYYMQHPQSTLIESAGRWSYSLYLMHGPLAEWIDRFQLELSPSILYWTIRLGLILYLSYLFYLFIEKPSHQLARWVSGRLSHRENTVI